MWCCLAQRKWSWKLSRMWIMSSPGMMALLPVRKGFGVRIANEILMHFRAQKKSAQDVSLSDYIETGSDGAPLELMDVVAEEGDLLEEIASRETAVQLRQAISECLSRQEQQVVILRYGLNGESPKRQRQVAQITGLSRSYISRIEKRALQKLKAKLAE